MKKTFMFALVLIVGFAASASAAGSPPAAPSVSEDIRSYNKGVELMLDNQFSKAEKQFRKALEYNERFAEAHNNLAYTLRKQGEVYYTESLQHYNRAIELNPTLSEPYMYRGVLYMQMGEKELALNDHRKLSDMKSPLADELEFVIANGREKEPEQFFGVSRKK
jgi:Flp pilus assembly protein TadD